MAVSFTLNGKAVNFDGDSETPILWVLRDHLDVTSPKFGCGAALCGACTVHIDGHSAKACNLLALQVDGAKVTTIEGLSKGAELHPVQAAFREAHGLQCGFCTPGMVMAAVSLLKENANPTEDDIRIGLEGNLCRCTGYHNIVQSVLAAAKK